MYDRNNKFLKETFMFFERISEKISSFLFKKTVFTRTSLRTSKANEKNFVMQACLTFWKKKTPFCIVYNMKTKILLL